MTQHFILQKKCMSMYTNRQDKNAVAALFMLSQMSVYTGTEK